MKKKKCIGIDRRNQFLFDNKYPIPDLKYPIFDSQPYLWCFISVYFNVNDELEAAAWWFPSLNDVAVFCSTCMWLFMYMCGVVFPCNQWRRTIQKCRLALQGSLASDAICSSEIVNKGGNTSNIMKHLLTKHIYFLKQYAVFTIQLQLQLARHIHIKCWFSGRVTLTRHIRRQQ